MTMTKFLGLAATGALLVWPCQPSTRTRYPSSIPARPPRFRMMHSLLRDR